MATPIASAAAERRGKPDGDQRVVAVHHLHRDRAGEPDIGRQRQVDIAGPKRDDEHLADADDHGEDGERQGRGEHAAGAVAAGEGDRREPDERAPTNDQIQGLCERARAASSRVPRG